MKRRIVLTTIIEFDPETETPFIVETVGSDPERFHELLDSSSVGDYLLDAIGVAAAEQGFPVGGTAGTPYQWTDANGDTQRITLTRYCPTDDVVMTCTGCDTSHRSDDVTAQLWAGLHAGEHLNRSEGPWAWSPSEMNQRNAS